MGTGASQSLRGHHSDSRISSLRLDGGAGTVTAVGDSSHSSCNNTVTLRFNLQDYASSSGSGALLVNGGKKPRARSLDGPDTSAATVTAASVSHELQALDEGREDHNSSAAMMVVAPATTTTPEAESNNNHSPRPVLKDSDDELLDYDTDPFEEEDESIEWTKADALGSGSYGTVYLARDERTGALMAVKEIIVADESDLDVANASREVTLLRSLRHVNIVKYLGSHVDVNARKLHIFTEWVPGGNLEQNRKRFAHHGNSSGSSERVVRRFTRQILSGVAYLHAKRIIHHDIKPSNLLVDQHGVVKLADFGSSRLLSSSSTVVNNESMRGTPNYMAPEVIKQSGPRNVASDIWSVGCSVLRLLTGKPLWGDKKFDSQIALLYFIAHLDKLPPLPADLSRDAHSFLLLCLEIDPDRRPSAEQLLTHPFVGGTGAFPSSTLSSSSSFLLPSRSTLLTLPPLHQQANNVNDLRVLTAPADYDAALIGAAAAGGGESSSPRAASPRRSPPASAPSFSSSSSGSAMSPTAMASRSQFVNRRGIPSRDPLSGATAKQDANDDEDNGDAPEIASLSSLPSLPSVQSSSSKSTKHMSRSRMSSSIVSLLSVPGGEDASESEIYTYSEFAETLATPRSRLATCSGQQQQWEDRPIRTDAALAERERQLQRAAEDARRKQERERKYQEELVEFRRAMLQPQPQWP